MLLEDVLDPGTVFPGLTAECQQYRPFTYYLFEANICRSVFTFSQHWKRH